MILITDYKLTINAKKVKKKLVTASFSCHCDNITIIFPKWAKKKYMKYCKVM